MNKSQNVLVNILSLAIRGQKVKNLNFDNINWDQVLDVANEHSMAPHLYFALKEYPNQSEQWLEYIESLKIISMSAVSRSVKHDYDISKVLFSLKNAGIVVVALKGIHLKNLYPYPELRTMGDTDILVSTEHLEESRVLLELLGYFESGPESKAVFLSHKSCAPIELHWALLNHNKFRKNVDYFESNIWNNIKSVKICGVEVYSLGDTDQLIHLCMHMVSHILDEGFGLRQLCDFVVCVEHLFDEISWNEFIVESEKMGIDTFVYAIFEVANNLLGLKVPKLLLEHKNEKKVITALTNFIIDGGTFGYGHIKWRNSQSLKRELKRGKLRSWMEIKEILRLVPVLAVEVRNYYYERFIGFRKRANLIKKLGIFNYSS